MRKQAAGSSGLSALLLPKPRPTTHEWPELSSLGGLSDEVERQLAAMTGIDQTTTERVPEFANDARSGIADVAPEFAARLMRVAEMVTLATFLLLVVAAVLAARFGDGSLHVHEIPFAAWGLGAALSALTLAAMSGHTNTAALQQTHRRSLGAALMIALLASVTGVVANADGAAGPAWVLYLPIVLVAGSVVGPALSLVLGAAAAAGLYVAAGLSHTLDASTAGRLVVLLPAFPAAGWSAAALAKLARDAAREAQWRRQALERDVAELSAVLERVAEGDLSVVPAPRENADPVTMSMAVVFADTLLALRRLVRQMDTVADQLAGSAVDLAGAAEQESAAIGAQVAAVAETTTTIEELAATAAGIADTAVRVSQFAGSTRRDVDAGGTAVETANVAMQRIAARVAELDNRVASLHGRIGRIADTTKVIDELAQHTSILAVNASIEAARAGDHGGGFTNVAREVGTLATRAREATARIDSIVEELRDEATATAAASRDGYDAVEAGAALQDDVVDALSRIAAMVDRTTTAAREITEATRQQRVASDAVVAAMSTVTVAGDRYRDGGRRHAEAAGRLRDLSTDLRAALARFRVA